MMRNPRSLMGPLLFLGGYHQHPSVPGFFCPSSSLCLYRTPLTTTTLSRQQYLGEPERRMKPLLHRSRLLSSSSSSSSSVGDHADHTWKRRVEGPEDMEELGRTLADAGLGPGNTLLLYGDLGTGKTCLARAIIRTCANDDLLPVTSPSYLLDNTYEGYDYETGEPYDIHHMDLYRLSGTQKDLGLLGFPKVLEECLCLIEWPERIGEYMPEVRMEVRLSAVDEETRDAEVKAVGGGWAASVLTRVKELDGGDSPPEGEQQ